MREIIPIYIQIADQLREKLLQRVFDPGEQLPTETILAQQFRVNRHTIRQAIGLLRNEGWLRVERGRGTFVAARTIRYSIGKRVRYNQTLKTQGWQVRFELLRILEVSADLAISRGLEISCGDKVALVERLGFANGEPICVCSGYFPLTRFPDFFEPSHLQILETEKSISRFLYLVYGCDHIRRSTAVSARLVQPQDAILLQFSDNQPILLAESVNVDEGGNVIEYGVTRFRGDRMELFFENDLNQHH
ncbi:transcriptional regulator [Raphidiopsis curvata NIES-932]|uniref:phosphonate metabolism transcriptional regulator PhnF n=1 Tax=Cylindrospermopsis raciborskii TaxID=77022 RepID=UPI000B6066F9|nr:transcriptional regulator [Raphidiopsis curvata NIES-932]